MLFSPFGKVKTVAMSTLQGGTLPIAIDFGASSLKVLQLHQGDTLQLVAAVSLPTPFQLISDPAQRFAFQFQALPRLIRAVGFRGKRAVAAIPAAQMFCKHMQFPKSDTLSVSDLVENAVPAVLDVPQQALLFRHVVVEGATPSGRSSGTLSTLGDAPGPRQEVICMAAARDMVGRVMQACKDSKLELVGMQPEYFCTLKAFDHINRRTDDDKIGTVYVDFGAGTTKVIIAHGNTMVFAKSIQLGGLDLDRCVAHALDCDIESAHSRRLESANVVPVRASIPAPIPEEARSRRGKGAAGGGGVAVEEDRRSNNPTPSLSGDLTQQPAEPVGAADFDLSDSLEILEDEIAMCLRYYETIFPGRRVSRAIFLGGESLHKGACQHIARRIRVPAQLADPLARVARTGKEPVSSVDFTIQQPGWAVPVGLSLIPTDL